MGPWTDLYALGVMAFEFYVGKAPFADTEEPMAVLLRHVNDRIPAVSERNPSVDPRISRWVEWLVSKEPSDRPQSAGEAWDALEETLITTLGPHWTRAAPLLEPGELPTAPPRPPPPPAVAVPVAAPDVTILGTTDRATRRCLELPPPWPRPPACRRSQPPGPALERRSTVGGRS